MPGRQKCKLALVINVSNAASCCGVVDAYNGAVARQPGLACNPLSYKQVSCVSTSISYLMNMYSHCDTLNETPSLWSCRVCVVGAVPFSCLRCRQCHAAAEHAEAPDADA